MEEGGDVSEQCAIYSLQLSLFELCAVGPRPWTVMVESPDKRASLTRTTVFTDNEKVQRWVHELKDIVLRDEGQPLRKMTTSFFSDCCGYTYSNVCVEPTKIPAALQQMIAHVMPACGLPNPRMWPTGINVNYYPDG